jgi:hypothetical protein
MNGVPGIGMPIEDDLYRVPPARSTGGRVLIALLLLLLVGGVGALTWTLSNGNGNLFSLIDGSGNMSAAPEPATPASPIPALGSAATPEALNGRMLELEQRIVRVQVASESASANANRAEAIMVAFASRRALDAGAPLGYLEGQVRLLFGDAQPKAVATIINAAADPVTINKLRAGLDDIRVLFENGDPKESWWSSARRTLSSLVELRRAGDPSPQPDQRVARARRAVEAGQVEDAIKEMAALPDQPAVAQWLEQARRYNEAHRALDVIEQAAILEPRTAPVIPVVAGTPSAPVLPAPEETPAAR